MPKENVTPQAHSEFGPSGSSRWMNCPASTKMLRQLKRVDKPNQYADYGTCAHELSAICLTDPTVEPNHYLGQVLVKGIKVDQEMVKGVEEYIEYIMSFQSPTGKLWVETQVSLEHLYPGQFGTADSILIDFLDESEGTYVLDVIDLKFGKGVAVEVEENSQLMLYGVGAVLHLQKQGIDISLIKKVNLHIVQPRCPHPDGPIRKWETNVEALKDISRRARTAIIDAVSDTPTFNPGEKQCRWCEASGFCRPLAEYNIKQATNEFSTFSEVEQEDFISVNTLTNAEISDLLKRLNLFEAWYKSIFGSAMDSLKRGESIPEFKLVRGRSNRRWESIEEEKLVKILNVNFKIPLDSLYKKTLLGPAPIEKLVKKEDKKKLEALIVKPEGKITMAGINDKRPAVDVGKIASDEFEEFADFSEDE